MQQPFAPTFYWHDYETFGLNTFADRPVQFAGLRTTMDFEPQGELDVWYARPALDYLPDPESCLVTGITPQEAMQKGVPEAEFAGRIFERFNTPGTIVVGYNNSRFDDHVTRALFWRNLFDLYAHQYRNGCSRWDLYPFVMAVWALRDEGIVWPLREDEGGAPPLVSFRLEKLTQANGIAHSHAHDAGSDVEATAAFAKFLAAKVPKLWNWALSHRDKDHVLAALGSGSPALWVHSGAGQAAGYLRFASPVAVNPENRNEFVVWDCREDPSVLLDLSAEEIARLAFGPKAAIKEGEKKLALLRMKVNTAPFVCADLRVVTPRVRERFSINLEEIRAHGEKLVQILNLVKGPVLEALSIARARPGEKDGAPARDADFSLYEGFVNEADKRRMVEVHALSPAHLAQRVQEGRVHFDDPRIDELLGRMRARSWPETLSAGERLRYQERSQAVLEGRAQGQRGIESYFEAIDALADETAGQLESGQITPDRAEQRETVLNALYDWGEHVAECVEALGGPQEHEP